MKSLKNFPVKIGPKYSGFSFLLSASQGERGGPGSLNSRTHLYTIYYTRLRPQFISFFPIRWPINQTIKYKEAPVERPNSKSNRNPLRRIHLLQKLGFWKFYSRRFSCEVTICDAHYRLKALSSLYSKIRNVRGHILAAPFSPSSLSVLHVLMYWSIPKGKKLP